MSADILLSKLEKVKRNGQGRWMACCPAHEDRSASLSIRELDDGRTLLHCFALCSVEDVLGAVGLTFDSLYPEKQTDQHFVKGEGRPFIPSDAFELARTEIGIVAILACDLHKNKEVSESDYQRIFVAIGRLNDIARVAYGK